MDDLSDALELTSEDFTEDEKILKGFVNFREYQCQRHNVLKEQM